MLAKADVFVQNLKPGALAKLGFAVKRLRKDYPRLICCSISGYGESGPYAQRKAYDLLIQAESGVSSVTGGPEGPARVGVSIVDIAAGLNAYEAILEALIARGRTRRGRGNFDLHVRRHGGMDDGAAAERGRRQAVQAHRARASDHRALRRVQDARRRRHPDRHPERPRMARAGRKSAGRRRARHEREIRDGSAAGSRIATKPMRKIAAVFSAPGRRALDEDAEPPPTSPSPASTIRSCSAKHPHLRRITVDAPSGPASIPAPAPFRAGENAATGRSRRWANTTDRDQKEFLS